MDIKTLVNILAVFFGVAFFDGALGLGFSDSVYTFIGLIEIIIITRLCFLVNKK